MTDKEQKIKQKILRNFGKIKVMKKVKVNNFGFSY